MALSSNFVSFSPSGILHLTTTLCRSSVVFLLIPAEISISTPGVPLFPRYSTKFIVILGFVSADTILFVLSFDANSVLYPSTVATAFIFMLFESTISISVFIRSC